MLNFILSRLKNGEEKENGKESKESWETAARITAIFQFEQSLWFRSWHIEKNKKMMKNEKMCRYAYIRKLKMTWFTFTIVCITNITYHHFWYGWHSNEENAFVMMPSSKSVPIPLYRIVARVCMCSEKHLKHFTH